MNCRSIETKLSSFLDQELGGADMLLVRDHISRCARCEAEMNQLKMLKGSLRTLKSHSPSPEFESKLREAISQESKQTTLNIRRPSTWMSMATAAFISASIVVVALQMMPRPVQVKTTEMAPSISYDQAAMAANNPMGNPNSALLISSGE